MHRFSIMFHFTLRLGSFDGIRYGIEHGAIDMGAATFTRCYTTYHLRAIIDHLRCVKGPFCSCKALYDDPGIFVN